MDRFTPRHYQLDLITSALANACSANVSNEASLAHGVVLCCNEKNALEKRFLALALAKTSHLYLPLPAIGKCNPVTEASPLNLAACRVLIYLSENAHWLEELLAQLQRHLPSSTRFHLISSNEECPPLPSDIKSIFVLLSSPAAFLQCLLSGNIPIARITLMLMDGCDVCLDQPQHAYPRIVQHLLEYSEQRPLPVPVPVRLVGIAHRLLVHEYDSVADLEHSIERLESVLHCRVETASDILSSVGLGSLPASALCSDAPPSTSATTITSTSTSSPSTPTSTSSETRAGAGECSAGASDTSDATAEEASEGQLEQDGDRSAAENGRRRGRGRTRDSSNVLLVGEKLRHCAPEPDTTGLVEPCRKYLESALEFYENWSGTLALAQPPPTSLVGAQSTVPVPVPVPMTIPAGLEPAELAHFAVSAVRECLTSLDELGPYCAGTTAEGTLKHLVAYEFQLAALDASLLERHTRLCSASGTGSGSDSVAAQAAPVEANSSGSDSVYGGTGASPAPPSCPCAQKRATVGTGLAFVRLAQSQLSKVRLLCDAYYGKHELSVEGTVLTVHTSCTLVFLYNPTSEMIYWCV